MHVRAVKEYFPILLYSMIKMFPQLKMFISISTLLRSVYERWCVFTSYIAAHCCSFINPVCKYVWPSQSVYMPFRNQVFLAMYTAKQ